MRTIRITSTKDLAGVEPRAKEGALYLDVRAPFPIGRLGDIRTLLDQFGSCGQTVRLCIPDEGLRGAWNDADQECYAFRSIDDAQRPSPMELVGTYQNLLRSERLSSDLASKMLAFARPIYLTQSEIKVIADDWQGSADIASHPIVDHFLTVIVEDPDIHELNDGSGVRYRIVQYAVATFEHSVTFQTQSLVRELIMFDVTEWVDSRRVSVGACSVLCRDYAGSIGFLPFPESLGNTVATRFNDRTVGSEPSQEYWQRILLTCFAISDAFC